MNAIWPSSDPTPSTHHSVRIVATQCYRLSTVTLHDPALILIQQGVKRLHRAGVVHVVSAGEAVLLARGSQWDVVNDPQPHGRYEAIALGVADAVLQDALQRWGPLFQGTTPGTVRAVQSAQRVSVDASLQAAVLRTLPASHQELLGDQGAQPPYQPLLSATLSRHRVLEVLLLLAERGWCFASATALDWSERVRRCVAQRPEAHWTVTALAAHFHVSESTLRRRLAACEVSLAALVREVQLETALGLLQTTALPVGTVAQHCGWASHSRFSAAFKERWGVAPSVVRAQRAGGPVQRFLYGPSGVSEG